MPADNRLDLTALESQFADPALDQGTPAPGTSASARPAAGPGSTSVREPVFPGLPGQISQLGLEPTRPPRARWETRFVTVVVLADLGALLACAAVGVLGGFGRGEETASFRVAPIALGLLTVALAAICLKVMRAWEPRVLGQGSEEFSRLTKSFVGTAVVLGLVGLLTRHHEVRPWVFGVIPAAGLLAALVRYALRKMLHRSRRQNRCVHKVLAVGTEASVADLIARTRRDRHNGWLVAGACTPTGTAGDGQSDIAGVPVIGDLDGLALAVRLRRYSVVAIAPAPGWTPKRLHQLAWDLEGTGADLVVHPGLMEVAGPRLHVAPVDGLPLLRLTEPNFAGLPRVIKNIVDHVAALVLLVLLAPLLLAVMVALLLEGGPVFNRQDSVGRGGKPFRPLRFAIHGRTGAMLHRWCLDELPQLFNVLAGSMSLVGPRPPGPGEVDAQADDVIARRLLVKPGLTGLWQVSGHREMSWDESVRLDLRYVENWTMALDALILWKTLEAVLRGDNAR